MPGHILRPSGGYRWAYCGGSYELEEEFPELQDSDKAREGNAAAHFVAESLLGRLPAIGSLAPNGHPIDAEMVESGEVYLAYCRAEMACASATALCRVETKLTMHGLIHHLNEGTPDFWKADAARKLIVVPDFKYGHRAVDAFMNIQLIDYAAGVVEGLELTRADIADWTIRLVIVQPRCFKPCGPVDEWTITGAYLFDLIEWLSDRAKHATTPGARCVVGEWCRDCSARVPCVAFQRAGADAQEVAREPIAHQLGPDALGLQLKLVRRAAARLKAMESGLEEVVKAQLRAGTMIPYFGMRPKAGREAWVDPAQVVALGDIMGVDLRKPPMSTTVLTPAQARDAGLDPELVKVYAVTKTSIELAEIDGTTAAKAFQ